MRTVIGSLNYRWSVYGVLAVGDDTIEAIAARRKALCEKKYRRWDLNPHALAGTGF